MHATQVDPSVKSEILNTLLPTRGWPQVSGTYMQTRVLSIGLLSAIALGICGCSNRPPSMTLEITTEAGATESVTLYYVGKGDPEGNQIGEGRATQY